MRDRSRRLRKDATLPERRLWDLLRDRRLSGFKFRRQHVIGPFVVDYFCPASNLVIELDGRSHDDRFEEDRRRQEYLEREADVRIFRIANDDVLDDPESVLIAILRLLDGSSARS